MRGAKVKPRYCSGGALRSALRFRLVVQVEAADEGGALERRGPRGVEAFAFEVMGKGVAGHGVIHFGERRVPDFLD